MEHTDGKKNIEDKIEEIIENVYVRIRLEHNVYAARVIAKQIATLCKEQRADAVKSFAKWQDELDSKYCGLKLTQQQDKAEEYLKEQNI